MSKKRKNQNIPETSTQSLDASQVFAKESQDIKHIFSQSTAASERKKFAHYEVLEKIGQGGMGQVFKVHDKKLKRTVALKLLLSLNVTPTELARFHRETKAMGKLHHPNIVTIYEIGEENKQPFFTMELVEGVCLKTIVKTERYSPHKTAKLLEKVARAIHYAHSQGIVHRDLKPGNIMVDKNNNEPKVMDFGLAKMAKVSKKLSQTGAILGTLRYMAPEQAEGKLSLIDARSDVYALGAILYEMLTGNPPFTSATSLALIHDIVYKNPVPPTDIKKHISRDLESICLKAIQKKPAKRYQSAKELADELERFINGESVKARPLGTIQRLYLKIKQHRYVFVTCIICIAIAIFIYKENAAQKNKNSQKAKKHFKQYIYYLNQKNIKKAHEEIEMAHKTFPQLHYQAQNIMLLHKNGSFAKAKKLALKIHKKLVKNQNSFSFYILGYMYQHGIGVNFNMLQAIKWYKKASDNSLAISALGFWHLQQKEYQKSKEYFLKAAQYSEREAMHHLGKIYLYGQKEEKDYLKAIEWFQKSAAQGHTHSAYLIGLIYQGLYSEKGNNYGVKIDFIQGIKWLFKASNEKHSYAMRAIGDMYHKGRGVEKNPEQALRWYQKAVNNGDSFSLNSMGIVYRDLLLDPIKAREYFEKAIKQKVFYAYISLGEMYQKGLGVVGRDYQKAKILFEKAVAKKINKAYHFLGEMHELGKGVAVDYDKALECYEKVKNKSFSNIARKGIVYYRQKKYKKAKPLLEKAVAQGSINACIFLGNIYHIVKPFINYKRAMQLYKKAANEKNSGYAMDNIGGMYWRGRGVKRDLTKALFWYHKAAQNRSASALFYIGQIYLESSREIAIEWFKKAQSRGNVNATKMLKKLGVK